MELFKNNDTRGETNFRIFKNLVRTLIKLELV